MRKTASRAAVALFGLAACMGTMQAANTLVASPATVNLNCTVSGISAVIYVKGVTAPTGTNSIAVSTTNVPTSLAVTAVSGSTLTSTTQTSNSGQGLAFNVAFATPRSTCAGLPVSATFNFKAGTVTDVAITVTFGARLTITPSATVYLNCDPASQSSTPASTTITVAAATALTGSNTLAVGAASVPTTLAVTGTGTLDSTTNTSLSLSIALTGTSCSGLPASATFNVTAAGVTDAVITVNIGTVGFSVSPTLLTLTCQKSGSTYSPLNAVAIAITATTKGTATVPFAVDTTGAAFVSPSSASGTAGSSATTINLTAAGGCGGFAVNTSNTGTVVIKDSAAGESSITKTITVVLKIVSPTPLTVNPASASLTYVKGSGSPGKAVISLTSSNSPAPFITVNPQTLPSWLSVDSLSGNVPKNLTFSSTSVADTLAPGTYNQTVAIQVSGYADLNIPISLLITNKAPTLTISGSTTNNITWVQGTSLPTPVITAVSSDSPIAYTVTTGGALHPAVAQTSGLAYNFGTQIPVSFDPVVFAAAQPGTTLTGTVSLTWGTPSSTVVVTFNVSVQSAGALISAISPAGLPTASAGQTFQVVLTGSGFVPGTDPLQKTRVGVVIGNVLQTDTNIATNVLNSSNMILTITVPSAGDANLPFTPSGGGGTVTLGVCNPINGTCTTPTSTITFTIGNNPIIQAVTSSSTFAQVTPPQSPTVAPYDMVSIFGTNFCTSGGTGCSTTQVLYGAPANNTMQYPFSLTPDAAGAGQRNLSVSFYQQGTTTLIATAPLLFATNSQINLLVPSAVFGQASADVVVNFGTNSSSPFKVNIANTDPGIFTIGQDGQGSGAILDAKWNLVGGSNPAGMRSTGTDSDFIQLYMTGLGVPDGGNVTITNPYPDACTTVANFLSQLNTAEGSSLMTLDGVVMQSAIVTSPAQFVPCLNTAPTVTVGGQNATVAYAGWVADTIAGLYQVNIQMPSTTAVGGVNGGKFTTSTGAQLSSITAPVQLPIVVTAGGVSSQTGVTVWVTPRLLVTAPSALSGTVGVAWPSSGNAVAAGEGTSPYHYAITSGVLPSGLSLNPTSGAITGTPAANTGGSYTVTVTATDAANVPVTGTATFNLTVAGALFVSSSNPGPFNYTFGTAHATVTQVTAAGGTYPYTYAITSPASLPTGMTVDANNGTVGVSNLTPAGTYAVSVQATDSAGTPLTGTANFTIVEALNMTNNTINNAVVNGNTGTITTITTTGQTGTVSYSVTAVDSPNASVSFVHVDSNGNVTVDNTCTAGNFTATVTATDSGTAAGSSAPAVTTLPVSFAIQ